MSNDFLTILLGGRLPETENKRMRRSRGHLRNLTSGRLREFLK